MEILTLQSFKEKVFNYETNKEWNFLGKKPAIIDFYADWCAPCRAMSPVIEDVANKYEGKIDVYKVNTELTPELSHLFEIRSVPSLLFIPMQEAPSMSVGLMLRENFDKAIQDLFELK